MEERPKDPAPLDEEEVVTPPPFDPDPNLVSLLERGAKDDPRKIWSEVTRDA